MSDKNTNSCPVTFNKQLLSTYSITPVKYYKQTRKLEKKSVFSMLFLKTFKDVKFTVVEHIVIQTSCAKFRIPHASTTTSIIPTKFEVDMTIHCPVQMLLLMAANATKCSTFEVQYGKSTSTRTTAIRHFRATLIDHVISRMHTNSCTAFNTALYAMT